MRLIAKHRYAVTALLLIILMTTVQVLMAQPPPPPPPPGGSPAGAPIDGGVAVLIGACLTYHFKKTKIS